jgi:hypothetical protein
MRRLAALPLLLGCAPADEPSPAAPTVPTCAAAMAAGDPVRSWSELAPLVEQVRTERYPELADVPLELVELTSETDFFVANLDLATASAPPLERSYRVLANPRLFPNPPPFDAVYAILVHELAHIRDYTELDTTELVEFGLWYATADTTAYERSTDEVALTLGCGAGLKSYRLWLYDQLTEEQADAKRATYYTPDEIDAWMAANGG